MPGYVQWGYDKWVVVGIAVLIAAAIILCIELYKRGK